ncbi:hypothetical protein DDZ13_07565 [Coraliomargarita sinensis]|uniref:Uncharacterized protein n=1 Tax=Coraliomargarita sinensis TaxID=2174842 RepID=A0A317ZLW7_9BACT|nr:hypothetical protein [Coraliomargarita sinensis]PXA04381.1 hypothetical protein DDZ13_07565 [Coraliomargarita sinensis]
MKYFFSIACFTLLTSHWISAQAPTDDESEVKGRKAWLVATTIPDDVPNPLKIIADDKLQEIRLLTRSVGAPFKVGETGVVRTVKEVIGADGELAYENLSMTTVPEGIREALIVLVPRKKDAEGLRFNSKVIDLAEFELGGFLYVNLVNTKIGIALDDHKAVVEPGGMKYINPLDGSRKKAVRTGFFYEVPANPKAEWELMTSFKMAVYDSRREICIFFYNERIENVDFRGISFITEQRLR